MNVVYVGIDVASAKLDVGVQAAKSRPYRTFANTLQGIEQLYQWLQRYQGATIHVCLEATGRYGEAVSEYLHAAGCQVSIINPAYLKAFAASRPNDNKTDKRDAALLAEFARVNQPRLWTPPPPHHRRLRDLLRRIDDLQDYLQRERNRQGAGTHAEVITQTFERLQSAIQAEIKTLETEIRHLFDTHDDLREKRGWLDSIPSIGRITAERILAESGDIAQFRSADQLIAYAGLHPRQSQSGKSSRPAKLSKKGNDLLRKALYMPAMNAIRFNPVVKALADRLQARGLAKMQILTAAMRKLLQLAFGVLKSKRNFDLDFRLSQQPTPLPP